MCLPKVVGLPGARRRLKPAADLPCLLKQADEVNRLLQQAWRRSVGIHPRTCRRKKIHYMHA
jgi:hypothetical protein